MCLEGKPTVPYDDGSVVSKVKLETWEWPNQLSMMIIKRTISEPSIVVFRLVILPRIFLRQKFKESDKVEVTNLVNSFSNARLLIWWCQKLYSKNRSHCI